MKRINNLPRAQPTATHCFTLGREKKRLCMFETVEAESSGELRQVEGVLAERVGDVGQAQAAEQSQSGVAEGA